jgi:hypothetical protein
MGASRDPTSDEWTQQMTIRVEQLRLLSADEAASLRTVILPTNYRIDDHTLSSP